MPRPLILMVDKYQVKINLVLLINLLVYLKLVNNNQILQLLKLLMLVNLKRNVLLHKIGGNLIVHVIQKLLLKLTI